MTTDLQTQSAAPFVYDGTEYAPLLMSEYGQLASTLHEHRKAWAKEQLSVLTEHGVKPMQLPLVLQSLSDKPTYFEVRQWLYTTDGAEAILRMRNVPMDSDDTLELHIFALRLAGIDIDDNTEGEGSGELPLSKGPMTGTSPTSPPG